jgi:hypothetical protein
LCRPGARVLGGASFFAMALDAAQVPCNPILGSRFRIRSDRSSRLGARLAELGSLTFLTMSERLLTGASVERTAPMRRLLDHRRCKFTPVVEDSFGIEDRLA